MPMFWLYTLTAVLTWTQCTAREKCMEELGCFGTGGEWFHLLRRPLILLPDDREVINTTFLLYTRQNSRTPRYLKSSSKESVTGSTFDAKKHTKVIIHGFMDNQVYGKWMQVMSTELLVNDDYNVIIVDWSDGNTFPYGQATVNSRVVGAEVALLLSRMQEWVNFNLSNTHLIGHSLGAHIVGYAGKRLSKVERITGLDPAEPYFQGMPSVVRLDMTDAKFVDVIHTDSKSIFLLGLGMSDPVGHVDFFPNGGRKQPGCRSDQLTKFITHGIGEGIRRFATCDHHRAVDYFFDSINHHECNFVGYACEDWDTFMEGKCKDCGKDGRGCAILGLKGDHYAPLKQDGKSVIMYLGTRDKEPFCLFQYRVTVYFYKGNGKYSDQSGILTANITGDYGFVNMTLNAKEATFKHGEEYTYLLGSDYDLGPITGLTFTYHAGFSLLRTKQVYVEKVEVASMNFIDKESRSRMTTTFCNKPEEGIVRNTPTKFKEC